MSEDVCSARIETLRGWADTGVNERAELGLVHQVSALGRAWDACVAACEFRDVEGNPGPELEATIDRFRSNEAWVRGIATALADAPAVGGIARRPSSDVAATIDGEGRTPDAGLIAYDDLEIVGLPVTSGLVNDPVNAANGNFVHADRDLSFPGFGAVLDVVRTYNSRCGARVGLFGAGWTSLLDVRLDLTTLEGGTVRLSFTDGSVVAFDRDRSTGDWRPDARRRLTLVDAETGWLVTRRLPGGASRCFRFDRTGALVGGEDGAARWSVRRQGEVVTYREERSDRWVRHHLDAAGLVVAVHASDGRRCRYTYDDGLRCVAVERPIGDLTYRHDDHGFLVASIDADGVAAFTNRYDRSGRVIGQTAPHGRRTTFEYLDNGGTRITDDDEIGESNLLFHDRRGNLLAMFGSDGVAMRAAYDTRGRLLRHTDRTGAVTTYVHDEHGEITRRIDPDGLAEDRTHDDLGRVRSLRDRAGATFTFGYDGANPNPAIVTGPEGARIVADYDDRWLPTATTDGDGVTTRFEWDADGQLVACTNGAGERTTLRYDRRGRLTSVTEPDGATVTLDLDAAGRVATTTDRTGASQAFTMSPAGRVLAMTTSGPGSWTAEYGPHGDLVAFSDATGATVGYRYDNVGRIAALIAPDGTVSTQEWDGLGQLVASTGPGGDRTSHRHDRAGRLVEVTRPGGRTHGRTVDVLGRTVTETGPDGASTHRSYHPNGQLATRTDADGSASRYEIDQLGRIVAEVGPGGGRRTYTYSPGSRLLTETTPAGRTVTYGYDAAGRRTTMTDPDGTVTEIGRSGEPSAPITAAAARFERDERSLLSVAVSPDGTVTSFEHDRRGRYLGATTGDHGAAVAYGPAGHLAEATDGSGTTTRFTHGPGGLLDRVVRGDRRPGGTEVGVAVDRDPAGRIRRVTDLDGRTLAAYRYDPAGELVTALGCAVGWSADGGGRDRGGPELVLGRDEHGRVVSVIDATGSTRYERDLDGVLTAAIDPAGTRTVYERTRAGRLVALVDDDAGRVELPSRAVGSEHRGPGGRRLEDRHGRRFRYDIAGRLTDAAGPDGGTWQFTFNDLGLLATDRRVEPDGSHRSRTFTYGDGGQLAAVTTTEGTSRFTHDGAGRRTSRLDPDGTRTTYTWDALDRLIEVTTAAADGTTRVVRLSHDGLGRVGGVVIDGTDEVSIGWDHAVTGKPIRLGANRYLRSGCDVRPATTDGTWFDGTYDDPYGTGPGIVPGGGIRLAYRGELTVDGLVFMGSRVYDPDTRSFLTKDPNPAVPGANGSFASPYEFAWADPVNHLDPSGREPVTIEEFEAWRERQEGNRFQRAGRAIADDPWGSLAMGVTVVGGTVLLATPFAPIGAGILIGAASSAAMGLATDDFDPRSVAIGGAFGAVPGGHTVGGAFAAGFGESLVSQVVVDGRGIGDISVGEAVTGGTFGAVIPAGFATRNRLRPAGPVSDLVPPTMTGGHHVASAPPPVTPPALPRGRENPWPADEIGLSIPAPEGLQIEMAMSPGQLNPGGFGTLDHIPDIDFVRNDLAVRPDWKPEISHVQLYEIPAGTRIQVGTVGPQTYQGVTYPGGASQVEILNYPDRATLRPMGEPRMIK